MHIFSRFL